MKVQLGIAALLLATSVGSASAQTMKPGLWEITTQMQGGSGEMADAMAKGPKADGEHAPRATQDDAGHDGQAWHSDGGQPRRRHEHQDLHDAGMFDRNQVASHQASNSQHDCTHSNSPRSGNTMQFSFVCTKPPSSGEGRVTFTSPEAYSMKMTSTSTVKGQPTKMDMQTDGPLAG